VRRRIAALAVLISCLFLGCSSATTPTPTPVVPAVAPLPKWAATWYGDSVLSSFQSSTCNWKLTAGSKATLVLTLNGNDTSFKINGGDAFLDGDLLWEGSVSGQSFSAKFGWSPAGACGLQDSTITGVFNDTFTSFDAVHTERYGPEGVSGTIERRMHFERQPG
jgi:hypothetical protein